jgi:hypothetical protein
MSDMCPNCKSKLLFAEPSYDNFNGCRMYVCRSEFRKSGECYFKSPLCEERKVHSETREDLEHWKIEYEIAVSRLCGIKHKRDNGIIAENEVIPKLQCELDEAQAKLDQTKDALADASAELALKKLQTEQVKSERDEARAVLSNLSHYLSCGLGDDSTTAQEYAARIREGINFLLTPILEDNRKLRHVLREAWLAMDEVEGTDRINDWQNKNAHILNIDDKRKN